MVCKNCGGDMVGDGYSDVRHCENLDLIGEGYEPDANPVYCTDSQLKSEINIALSQQAEPIRAIYAAPIAQTSPQVPPRMEMEPYQTVDRRSTNYKAGWNACRKAMLEGQTAPQPEQRELVEAAGAVIRAADW